MKKNTWNLIPKIKKDILWFIIDESWSISKEDAIKLASLTLLTAWVVDVNAATLCIYSCWC